MGVYFQKWAAHLYSQICLQYLNQAYLSPNATYEHNYNIQLAKSALEVPGKE